MTLFEQIISEVLVSPDARKGRADDIIFAINNIRKVRLTYSDGKKDRKGKNERTIIPIAYGIDSRSGNEVLRAYQLSWSSKRGYNRATNNAASMNHPSYYREKPHWKLFIVDNIFGWSTERRKASKSEIEAIKADGLNQDGDKLFSKFFALSPICNKEGIEIQDVDVPIKSTPVTKADINPNNKGKETEEKPELSQQTVDNTKQNNYTVNDKLNAPETKPIEKSDINPNAEEPIGDTEERSENNLINYNDKPITKQDITEPENPKNSEFVKNFNDLTQRMDALNKEEDEEENEE